jgi:hypothetical protein
MMVGGGGGGEEGGRHSRRSAAATDTGSPVYDRRSASAERERLFYILSFYLCECGSPCVDVCVCVYVWEFARAHLVCYDVIATVVVVGGPCELFCNAL